MTKGGPKETRASKLDALHMKNYHSYIIKQNCHKSIEWLVVNMMAPLDYVFGNHHLCDANQCHCKSVENKSETIEIIDKNSELTKKGYYRCMTKDKRLYDAMTTKYSKYITYNFMK